LLVARKVGVDELDEAVEVLGCYLKREGEMLSGKWARRTGLGRVETYRFVLLVKVVDVAVENLHE
jgi:hypothetical protein